MQQIDKVYIDGAFVTPHGEEWFELFNPAKETVIGKVRLADAEDARRAIAAAKRAFPAFSRTSKRERIALLEAHARRGSSERRRAIRSDRRRIWRTDVTRALDGEVSGRRACGSRQGLARPTISRDAPARPTSSCNRSASPA